MLDMGECSGMISDMQRHGMYSGKVDACLGFHFLGLHF